MAMAPIMTSGNMQGGPQEDLPAISVDVPQPMNFDGGAQVTETPDGALIEEMQDGSLPEDMDMAPLEHGANISEYLDDAYLGEISSELRASYEEDLDSRAEWAES